MILKSIFELKSGDLVLVKPIAESSGGWRVPRHSSGEHAFDLRVTEEIGALGILESITKPWEKYIDRGNKVVDSYNIVLIVPSLGSGSFMFETRLWEFFDCSGTEIKYVL